MPRREWHYVVGALAGLGALLVMRYARGDLSTRTDPVLDVVELVAYVVPAVAGSRLPDILEPPASPKHRGVFHSLRFFMLVLILLIVYWIFFNGEPLIFLFAPPALNPMGIMPHLVLAFIVGYGSHVVLDTLA